MIILMAWRNIWRNKMRSTIIIFSIIIGIFAGIAVLALYKGMMKSRVNTVIYSEIGHLQVHDKRFKNDFEPQFIISNGAQVLKIIRENTKDYKYYECATILGQLEQDICYN